MSPVASIYATIGLLAIQVALHVEQRGRPTSAARWRPSSSQPFGHALLIAVAVGLGGYALWRFVQAGYGNGPEGGGDSSAMGRIVALGSGIAYLAMCGLAISILLGTSSRKSSSPHRSAAGVLGWPGGRYIVAAAGVLFIAIALYQGYKGVSKKFLEEDKTDQMGPRATRHSSPPSASSATWRGWWPSA